MSVFRIVALVAIMLAAGCSKLRRGHRDSGHRTVVWIDAGSDVPTAGQIFDEYQTNEIAAHRKYNGHSFELTGVVIDVRESFGAPVLQLQGADHFGEPSEIFSLNVFLGKSDLDAAAVLDEGDTVRVRCSSSARIGTPFLSDCVLISSARPDTSR